MTCWTDGFAEAVAGDIGARRRRSSSSVRATVVLARISLEVIETEFFFQLLVRLLASCLIVAAKVRESV